MWGWGDAEAHTAQLPHRVNRHHRCLHIYPMLMANIHTKTLHLLFTQAQDALGSAQKTYRLLRQE